MKFKRDHHDLLDFYTGFPSDIELEDDNELSETTEHSYYVMTTHTNNEELFSQNYVDIQKWIDECGASGQIDYSHLGYAYRISMEVKLKFDFPFYGHKLQKLTIGVGGFIYVGDQTYSWLAATQIR